MSHEEGSTAAPLTEYGSYPSASSSPSYSSSTRTRAASPPAIEPVAMQDSGGISGIERWAVRASDSQFNALSGAIGGFASGIVTCPLDVIKTKLQAQGGFNAVQKGRHVGHHKAYKGLVGTAKIIWKDEGIRGMYRGLGPIILGYLPTWATWFTVYNKSKAYLGQYHRKLGQLAPEIMVSWLYLYL